VKVPGEVPTLLTSKSVRLGHAEVVVTRPPAAAADPGQDVVFIARSALQRAYRARAAAEIQVDQLRALVDHLDAERRAP
jgi:hypothetical protein